MVIEIKTIVIVVVVVVVVVPHIVIIMIEVRLETTTVRIVDMADATKRARVDTMITIVMIIVHVMTIADDMMIVHTTMITVEMTARITMMIAKMIAEMTAGMIAGMIAGMTAGMTAEMTEEMTAGMTVGMTEETTEGMIAETIDPTMTIATEKTVPVAITTAEMIMLLAMMIVIERIARSDTMITERVGLVIDPESHVRATTTIIGIEVFVLTKKSSSLLIL